MLLNKNLIHKDDMKHHIVQPYQFQTIADNPNLNISEDINEQNETEHLERVDEKVEIPIKSFEKELIEKLLKKCDELSTNLAGLQIQFEKTQVEMKENINRTAEEAFKRGLEQGKNEASAQLKDEVEREKEKITQSLITLENTLKDNKEHLEALEKELSTIAIDMAKEVIIKEIDENSQKVAFELTKELLANVSNATQIKLKVNPVDYVYLKENLKDIDRIEISSDNAISRGGVIVSSNLGNLDGNIMSRYRMLKQSVLENLEDS